MNPRARAYLGLPQGADGHDFLQAAHHVYRLEPVAGWQQWEVDGTFSTPCYLVQPETLTARVLAAS